MTSTGRAGSTPDAIFVDRDFEAQLVNDLMALGWRIFSVEGGESVESFFLAAKRILPMDPSISGNVHWDALSDSLFGGLDALGAQPVALVWRDADHLLLRDDSSFSIALEVLTDVADTLRQERSMLRTEASLRSFLLGKGARFSQIRPADLKPPEK